MRNDKSVRHMLHRLRRLVCQTEGAGFGDAKPEQMKAFAEAMSGRMFDGRVDVVQAFREAKGYN